jgi:hypothetical protein
MLYSDWLKNFEQAQICNLSPDSFEGQLTAQQVVDLSTCRRVRFSHDYADLVHDREKTSPGVRHSSMGLGSKDKQQVDVDNQK